MNVSSEHSFNTKSFHQLNNSYNHLLVISSTQNKCQTHTHTYIQKNERKNKEFIGCTHVPKKTKSSVDLCQELRVTIVFAEAHGIAVKMWKMRK